jgi:hypothetical protein
MGGNYCIENEARNARLAAGDSPAALDLEFAIDFEFAFDLGFALRL